MHSFEAPPASSHYAKRIHLALTGFGDIRGTLACLTAYLCTPVLIAMLGIYLWDPLPNAEPESVAKTGWSLAARSAPAFAVSQFDLSYKTDAYQILRHPEGGRKDVLRWTDLDGRPAAELEIHRPGGELNGPVPAIADIAGRMDLIVARAFEPAGVIDSKFGAVTLLLPTGEADGARSCIHFLKRIDQPNLRISGWSCQGETLPARRTAIACTLNRLMLLTAGNDPKLAELCRTQAQRLCGLIAAGVFSRLGDGLGQSPAARRVLIADSGQAAGFHATFNVLPALSRPVWPN